MTEVGVQLEIQQTGDCLVSFVTSGRMQDTDLRRLLTCLDNDSVRKCLIRGPLSIDGRQRRTLLDVLERRGTRLAMLTNSRETIGIATAMTWLGPVEVRTFPEDAMTEALEHLKTSGVERARILRVVEEYTRTQPALTAQ